MKGVVNMFSYFAPVCFLVAVAYVWIKRTESFFVKLACSLVFGVTAYCLAVGLGLMVGAQLPSKWLVEHTDLVPLYQDGENGVLLETISADGKPYLHFKRSGLKDSEFVPKDGNSTVHAEGGLIVLRIHRKEFVKWGYWLAWLAVAESNKYDFILPKDKCKNVLDN